jgi:hypothetical protein
MNQTVAALAWGIALAFSASGQALAQHPCPPGGDPEGRILIRQQGDISCREWWAREAERMARIAALNQRVSALNEAEKASLRGRLLDHIRDELRDGPAARFQDIKFLAFNSHGPQGQESVVYCVWGRVNDKNQYGGYTGFVPFTAQVTIGAGTAGYVAYMPGPTPPRFRCEPTQQFPGF